MSAGVGSGISKELWRSIASALGRFLAIAGIVALGCGFYAGLRMTGADMRLAADAFYDGTRLYDIRVLSSLGFDDAQVDVLRGIEGVDAAMPAMAADAMCALEGEQYAMRIMSVPGEWMAGSEPDEQGVSVASPVDDYLNRLVLAEGSWPERADQCLLSADRVMGEPIRIGDEVEVLYGTSELDDVLEIRTFEVCGLAHSSAFPSNATLGYTNLGSGIIKQYMFVRPDAFSEDLPHTEVFLSVAAATDEIAGSDAYQQAVDEVADRIEAHSPELAASRLATIRADAQAEIDDAQAEFDEQSAEAEQELSDAQQKLDDALAELEDGMAQIASGQAEYEDGVAQLARARRQAASELASAREQLASAQRELDAGEAALGMTQADIDAARAKLDEGRAQLAEGEAAWKAQRDQLSQASGQAGSVQSALSALLDLIAADSPGEQEIAQTLAALGEGASAAQALATSAALDDTARAGAQGAAELIGGAAALLSQVGPELPPDIAIQQLSQAFAAPAAQAREGMAQLAAGLDAGISEGDATIAASRAELEKSVAQLAEAQAARDKLDAGWAELEAGRSELAAQERRAASELASAQATLDDAAAELASARAELAEGQQAYEQGKADLASASAEVDARLADAAAQLAEARADVDALEAPDIYVLDRTKNVGVASYRDDSKRIDAIARVFPAMFFLVAALVALTTMTRMVEDERTEIGTHKALGFSTAQITGKYVAYAALAGVLGAALGIGLFSQALPIIIEIAYAIMYNIPVQRMPVPVHGDIAAQSAGIGVGVTLLATGAAAAATLREVPASLMLPRAPKAGKRILLEHIHPIWDRVSFSWKVTLRNLFRYKRRFAMTVVGIAGCTALLLVGLGLHDSIWDIISKQFESASPVVRYNLVVGLEDEAGEGAFDEVGQLIQDEGGTVLAHVSSSSMQLSSEQHATPQAVSVYVSDDPEGLAEAVDLRERVGGEDVPFGSDSVVLTEKMAARLGVRVGDAVRVFEQDDIGNATGQGVELVLTGISENYVFHYLYVGADAWEEAFGEGVSPDTMLAHIEEDDDVRRDVSRTLLDSDDVATVIFNTETIDSYRKSLRSVNMIVVVLVVAAAALAFIVLYNLTNINIIERTREIASLKVLGFTRFEVAAYVFREIALLVIMGALLGLALGTALEGFVVTTAEVDAVMFGREIHPPSYAYSFGLTLVFSALVMAAMLPKLRAIDMVESLKSVD